jgi:hypothetical protein
MNVLPSHLPCARGRLHCRCGEIWGGRGEVQVIDAAHQSETARCERVRLFGQQGHGLLDVWDESGEKERARDSSPRYLSSESQQ